MKRAAKLVASSFAADREIKDAEWQQKLRAFLASLGRGQTKRKSLDPKRVAGRGPLLKGYVYYSRLSSDAAHPTLASLQRYLGRSQENGQPIRTIDINPLVSPGERRQTLMMVCEALLGMCVGVMGMLELQPVVNNELAALMQEYLRLGFPDVPLSKKPEGDQNSAKRRIGGDRVSGAVIQTTACKACRNGRRLVSYFLAYRSVRERIASAICSTA
jgi:hypothetical protein